jgi:ABC-type branched-subunit amino acid transport system substrate-binding protein
MTPIAYATVERNSLDVRKAASVIAKSSATVVVLGSVYGATMQLVREFRTMGAFLNYGSVSFVGTSSLLDKFGDEAKGIAISQVMPIPQSGTLPITREYQRAMLDAGHDRFTYGSIEGYIAAKVFLEGVRRAGPDLTRERLIVALETMDPFDAGGFAVNFSPGNHNGSTFTELTVVGANRTLIR